MTNDSYSAGFGGLGIAPGLLQAIARLNFTEPTPVQRRTIPVGLEGKDLIAIAQTGTGKTLAFGIPLIQRLAHLKGRGLVLLPTRELAIQVSESLHAVGKTVGFRTAVVIGGAPEGQHGGGRVFQGYFGMLTEGGFRFGNGRAIWTHPGLLHSL